MSRPNVFFLTACLLVAGASVARTEEPATQIGAGQVAEALSAYSIHITPEQIVLPAPVTSRHNHPLLEILSFDPLDSSQTRVKVRCRILAECLPFLVTVLWQSAGEQRQANSAWTKAKPAKPIVPPPAPLLVHSGDTATLVLEGQHVRIQLPVICLSNGSAGRTIRVSTTDRKQIYRAEVVGAGLVKHGL